jgi:RimJ/RimL family protein N-acetyltransferase
MSSSHYIVETERLKMREFIAQDAEAMYELNRDWEVIQYTGDVAFDSIEETKTFLTNYSDYKRNGFGRWIVELKETNEILGWCGLKRLPDGNVDIGYRFSRKYWGKGYATESAKACLDYGFNHLNLDEIIGNSAIENEKSIRVFDKLRLKFVKKKSCDGIENAVRYRILKKDFN